MNQDVKALPVVAYGYANTRPTGERYSLMMVSLDNSGDQYPELALPLVLKSDAESAIAELRAEVERYKAIATGVRSYLTDALAMALAEEDGHEGDDKHRLIWSGGAAPEPEGEVWQRYLGKAGVIAEKALASVADWSAAEDAYYTELRDECIEQARIDKQRADTAEARLERAKALLRTAADCADWAAAECAHEAARSVAKRIAAFLGEGK